MPTVMERRMELLDKRKRLHAKTVAEDRDFITAEQVQFDEWGEEAERLKEATDGRQTFGCNTPLAASESHPSFTTGGQNRTERFSGIGEMMCAIARARRGEGFDRRLEALQASARQFTINETSGSEGGFGVPEEFIERALAAETGNTPTPLLDTCDRQVMKSQSLFVPVFSDDSHSTAPYGIAWKQIPEEGTIDATAVTMRGLRLEAKKSGALVKVSNEWLSDTTPGIRQRLDNAFMTSMRWYIESLLWTGNGAGQPLGAISAPATLSIAKEVGQAADTIVVQNVDKMWARLRPGSHARAIWVANQTPYPQLAGLSRVSGVSGTPVMQPSLAEGPPQTINGRPLYLSEHLPAVGDSGDLCLLDPLFYMLGDRQAVTIDLSSHVYFATDQTAFRILARFDGQPIVSSVMTPKNGDTVSWCVKIDAR